MQQSFPGAHAIGWRILGPIGNPDIHDCRIIQFPPHVLADPAAGNAMINPELPNGRIGVAEGQILRASGMRKARGIEIEAKAMLLCPANPILEVGWLNPVAL